MNTIKERLKSTVVWLAVISQIVGIIVLFKPEIADTFKVISISVVEILTLFGILNNPTSRNEF